MNSTLLDTLFLSIGKGFSPDVYLLTTKIQGILWSIADFILVFCLLAITDMMLKQNRRQPIRIRYGLLFLSILPVPLLLFTSQGAQFFIIECFIFGIQFSVILYTIAAHIKEIIIFFRNIIVKNNLSE